MKKSLPILAFIDPGFLSFLQVIFWTTFLFFRFLFLAFRFFLFSLLPALFQLANTKDKNAPVLARGSRWGSSSLEQLFPRPVTLSRANSQNCICYGDPGTGKSTLALALMCQDMEASPPRAFAFVDPHEDTAKKALATLIACGYAPEDCVILDPSTDRYGFPGLNLFEPVKGQHPFEVVSEVLGAFRQIWQDAFGPRTESLLRNCFLALQEVGLTLSEAQMFLTNAGGFRSAVLQAITNQEVKNFWAHFDSMRDQHTVLEAPRNKLENFLGHPFLHNLFSQSVSTINFFDLMNQRKCLIANVSRHHLKDSYPLLTSLLLSKLLLAALARTDLPEEDRNPVSLYADEFHEYVTEPTSSLLALAAGGRKFGVSVKAFAQTPSQVQAIAPILSGTCPTTITFCVDRKAAEFLAPQLFTFTGQRSKPQAHAWWEQKKSYPVTYSVQEERELAINALTTQPRFHCIIRIRGDQDDGIPWVAQIPPPVTFPVTEDQLQSFRAASAKIYYRSSEQIEEDRRRRLARWLTPPGAKARNRS